MSAQTASRTLVKSPPELWAALSDPESLAQHLGEFGEIRITRLEAESNVAWEGERARGTIELSPTAWGTRVTLTAEPARQAALAEAPVAAAPVPPALPPSAPSPATPTLQAPRGGGLLDRIRRAITGSPRPPAPARAATPPPPVGAPPAPVRAAMPPPPAGAPPAPMVPAPPDIGAPVALAPDRTLAVLTSALDALGAAHHRPFSRD